LFGIGHSLGLAYFRPSLESFRLRDCGAGSGYDTGGALDKIETHITGFRGKITNAISKHGGAFKTFQPFNRYALFKASRQFKVQSSRKDNFGGTCTF
jgi:hypothetical protein